MADRPTYVWTGSAWDTIADPGAVRKSTTNSSNATTFQASSATSVPLRVQGAVSQSANLLQLVNSAGTGVFAVTSSGRLAISDTTSSGGATATIESGKTSTTPIDNVVLRIQTSGANRDCTLQLSDGVTNSAAVSMAAGDLYFSTNGVTFLRTEGGRLRLIAGNVFEAPVVTNAQTTSYTLVLADAGKLIEINNAGATTLTIPADASVAFPVGTKIDVLRTGAGEVSIAGAGGVTVNSESGRLRLNAQWSAATLIKRATNTWVLIGSLKA